MKKHFYHTGCVKSYLHILGINSIILVFCKYMLTFNTKWSMEDKYSIIVKLSKGSDTKLKGLRSNKHDYDSQLPYYFL